MGIFKKNNDDRYAREVADLRDDADRIERRDPGKAQHMRETANRLDRDPQNPRNRGRG